MADIRLYDASTSKTLSIKTADNIKEDVSITLPASSGTVLTNTNVKDVLREANDELSDSPIVKPQGTGAVITDPSNFDGYIIAATYTTGETYAGKHDSTIWQASTDPEFNNIIDTAVNIDAFKTSWRPIVNLPSTKVYVRYKFISGLMASPWSSTITFTTPASGVKSPKVSITFPEGNKLQPTFIIDGFNTYGTESYTHSYTNWKITKLDGTDIAMNSLKDNINLLEYRLPKELESNEEYILEVNFGLDVEGNETESVKIQFQTVNARVNNPIVNVETIDGKVTLVCSEFQMLDGVDTHKATNWELRNSTGGLVKSLIMDTDNLTSLNINSLINAKETYTIKVQYYGNKYTEGLSYTSDIVEYAFTAPDLLAVNITADVTTGVNGLPELRVDKFTVNDNQDTIQYLNIEIHNAKTNSKVYEEQRVLTPQTEDQKIVFTEALASSLAPIGTDFNNIDKDYIIYLYKSGSYIRTNLVKLQWSLPGSITVTEPILTETELANPKLAFKRPVVTGYDWVIQNGIEVKLYKVESTGDTLLNTTIIKSDTDYKYEMPGSVLLELNGKYKLKSKLVTNWFTKEFKTMEFIAPSMSIIKPKFTITGEGLEYNFVGEVAEFIGDGTLTHEKTELKIVNDANVIVWENTISTPSNIQNIKLPVTAFKNNSRFIIKAKYIANTGLKSAEASYVLNISEYSIKAPIVTSNVFSDNRITTNVASFSAKGYSCTAVAPRASQHDSTTWRLYNNLGVKILENVKDKVNKTQYTFPNFKVEDTEVGKIYTLEVIFHNDTYGDSIPTKVGFEISKKLRIPDSLWTLQTGDFINGGIFGDVPVNLVAPTCPEHCHEIAIRTYCGEWGDETNFRKGGAAETKGATAHYPYKVGDRVSLNGKYYECLVDQDWGAFNPSTETTKWKEVTDDYLLPSTVELLDYMGINWGVTEAESSTITNADLWISGGQPPISDILNNDKFTKIISPTTKKVCYISTTSNINELSWRDAVCRNKSYGRVDRFTSTFGNGTWYIRYATEEEMAMLDKVDRVKYETAVDTYICQVVPAGTENCYVMNSGIKKTRDMKPRAGGHMRLVITPIEDGKEPWRKENWPTGIPYPVDFDGTMEYDPFTDIGYFGVLENNDVINYRTFKSVYLDNFGNSQPHESEPDRTRWFMYYWHGEIKYITAYIISCSNNTATNSFNDRTALVTKKCTQWDSNMGAWNQPKDLTILGKKFRHALITVRRRHISVHDVPAAVVKDTKLENYNMGTAGKPFQRKYYATGPNTDIQLYQRLYNDTVPYTALTYTNAVAYHSTTPIGKRFNNGKGYFPHNASPMHFQLGTTTSWATPWGQDCRRSVTHHASRCHWHGHYAYAYPSWHHVHDWYYGSWRASLTFDE